MHPRFCCGLTVAVCLVCALPLWGAEKPEDPRVAEEEEAAEEEERLQAQGKIPDEGHETVLQGKYLVTQQDKSRPDIPGVFLAGGRAYKVKLQANHLLTKLAPFNGKRVTLGGKIRNQGKYFIVGEVLTQPGGTFVPGQAHTAPGRL